MSDFRWEEPPVPNSQRRPYRNQHDEHQAAGRLLTRPGEWARVKVFVDDPESPANTAVVQATRLVSQIRHGRRAAFRPDDTGHFEAVSRAGQVWARFILKGGTSDEETE